MSDILIVDDDQDVLEMLNEMVNRMGHHPESSSTLKDARQKLLSHDYDVIFLDVRLSMAMGLTFSPDQRDAFNARGYHYNRTRGF